MKPSCHWDSRHCLTAVIVAKYSISSRGVTRSNNAGWTYTLYGEYTGVCGAPSGVQSPWRSPPPPGAETLLGFGAQTEARNLLHSPYFANSLNSKLLWLYMRVSDAPNNADHTPSSRKNSLDLHQSQEWLLANVGWTCPPQSTPWRRPWSPAVFEILR